MEPIEDPDPSPSEGASTADKERTAPNEDHSDDLYAEVEGQRPTVAPEPHPSTTGDDLYVERQGRQPTIILEPGPSTTGAPATTPADDEGSEDEEIVLSLFKSKPRLGRSATPTATPTVAPAPPPAVVVAPASLTNTAPDAPLATGPPNPASAHTPNVHALKALEEVKVGLKCPM
jgi:hypothetical protein